MEQSTTVVLAHPDTLLREGLAEILRHSAFDVVGQTGDPDELRQLVCDLRPLIALVDRTICDAVGATVAELVRAQPELLVVVLTRGADSRAVFQSIAAGARGHLSVSLPPKEFLSELLVIARGDVVISHDMVKGLTEHFARERMSRAAAGLSRRETEVLRLVGQGSSNRQIAQELFISEYTVKAHVRAILGKLDVRSRQQAAVYAIRNGLASRARH